MAAREAKAMDDSVERKSAFRQKFTGLSVSVALFSVAWFLTGYVTHSLFCKSDIPRWIYILFSIPALYVLFFPLTMPDKSKHRNIWLFLVAISSAIHNASWWCFSSLTDKQSQTVTEVQLLLAKALAWANLAWSGIIILLSFAVVAMILGNGARSIKSEPFKVVCLCMMSFIHITYSLAFCLALHDRGARLINHSPSLTMEGAVPTLASQQRTSLLPDLDKWCHENSGLTLRLLFHFNRDSSSLGYDSQRFDEENQSNFGPYCKDDDDPGVVKNTCHLHDIQRALMCQDPDIPIQLLVESRAGNSIDLAQKRIAMLRIAVGNLLTITEKHAWQEEGHFLARSEKVARNSAQQAKDFPDPLMYAQIGPISSSRWIMAARIPSLLDYIYFTVYTITTTGYGDIKPTDDYSKFVTTVANLYEVFFIVIVFNVLLSVRRDEDPVAEEWIEESTRAAEASEPRTQG
jgi:Ion channel